jgi:hypothetical protein
MLWNSGARRLGSTAREAQREKFQAEVLERFRRLMSRREDGVVARRVQVRESSTSSLRLESGLSSTSCQEISRRRSPGLSAKVKTAV